MRALAIATTGLRRTFRSVSVVVVSLAAPLLLVFVLGLTFGGSQNVMLGVVSSGSGALGAELVQGLEKSPHVQVVEVSDYDTLKAGVERGKFDAGVVIPNGYDAS